MASGRTGGQSSRQWTAGGAGGTKEGSQSDTVPFNMFIDEIESLIQRISKLETQVQKV